jgi:Zn-dependent M28 family amino/carboxypeptidase
MHLLHSRNFEVGEVSPKIARILGTISEEGLRKWVEQISVPRHFVAEKAANRAVAEWIEGEFGSMGYRTARQGEYSNIVARSGASAREVVLVGAHYDSVPMCPGADDNGSAVAAMLGCAEACALWRPELPVVFVAFNCEEDGFLGSTEFVTDGLPTAEYRVRCAHILEMVGYASEEAGSQRVPPELPIKLSDNGNFLGLLANSKSADVMKSILKLAGGYAPDLPVTGLEVVLGIEKLFPVLARSDHVPFWNAGLPSVMWTDTSEFRNPNYHHASDTPETLNYGFLRNVTKLLTALVIQMAEEIR